MINTQFKRSVLLACSLIFALGMGSARFIQRVQAQAAVADKPAVSAQASEPGKTAKQNVITLQWKSMENDEHIFVPIQLNKEIWRYFILDTGSPYTFLDGAVAQQLKLPTQKTPAQNGPQVAYVSCSALLSSEFAPVSDLQFLLTNLGPLHDKLPDYAGIVGMSLLRNFAFSIDFDAHRVQLLFPGKIAGSSYVPNGAQSLPLTQRGGHYYVQTLLDEQAIEFEVDTGTYNHTFFDRAMLPLLKPQAVINGPRVAVMTKSGTKLRAVSTKLLQMRTLRVGNYEVKEPVVMVTEREKGVTANLLGLSFFENFKVIFDFPANVIYLMPGTKTAEKLHEWLFAGLQMQRDQDRHWTVSKVDKESPAAQAGLQAGDEVLELAGQPASMLSKALIAELLMNARTYNVELRGKALHQGTEIAYSFKLRFK